MLIRNGCNPFSTLWENYSNQTVASLPLLEMKKVERHEEEKKEDEAKDIIRCLKDILQAQTDSGHDYNYDRSFYPIY